MDKICISYLGIFRASESNVRHLFGQWGFAVPEAALERELCVLEPGHRQLRHSQRHLFFFTFFVVGKTHCSAEISMVYQMFCRLAGWFLLGSAFCYWWYITHLYNIYRNYTTICSGPF